MSTSPLNGAKKLLTIEEMLGKQDVVYGEVDVPEWGGAIRIGTLDAQTMMEFVEENKGPGRKTAGARLVLKSLVDAEGNRIGKPELIQMFMKKSSKVMNRLADEIMRLNGLTPTVFNLEEQIEAVNSQERLDALVQNMHALADALAETGPSKKKLHETSKEFFERVKSSEVKNA